MLVLTRRIGETLCLGDDITVTVVGCNGNQVRLAIDAPKEVAVHRQEIYQRLRSEGQVSPVSFGRTIIRRIADCKEVT